MRVTTQQACQFFEIHKATLTAWKKLGADAAYLGRNSWDLKKLNLWWIEHIFSGPVNECDNETLSAAKLDYWRAKADRERLRADQEHGELVAKEDIAPSWSARMREICSGLEAFGSRINPKLEARNFHERQRVIDDGLWELRDNFCRSGKFCHPEDTSFFTKLKAAWDALKREMAEKD